MEGMYLNLGHHLRSTFLQQYSEIRIRDSKDTIMQESCVNFIQLWETSGANFVYAFNSEMACHWLSEDSWSFYKKEYKTLNILNQQLKAYTQTNTNIQKEA